MNVRSFRRTGCRENIEHHREGCNSLCRQQQLESRMVLAKLRGRQEHRRNNNGVTEVGCIPGRHELVDPAQIRDGCGNSGPRSQGPLSEPTSAHYGDKSEQRGASGENDHDRLLRAVEPICLMQRDGLCQGSLRNEASERQVRERGTSDKAAGGGNQCNGLTMGPEERERQNGKLRTNKGQQSSADSKAAGRTTISSVGRFQVKSGS